MPLRIRERPPRKFNVVKPRNEKPPEQEGMKKTPGTTRPETLQSVAKKSRQQAKDVGGRSGWRAPSDVHHSAPEIDSTMNKNYEDYFFKINKGHNRGSSRPGAQMSTSINGADFFR